MVSRTIKILDWKALFFFAQEGDEFSCVLEALDSVHAPADIFERVYDNLKQPDHDEGFTYSNTALRESVVYIGPTSSGEEFLSSFVHELAHLTCDICVTDNISLRGEKIAYLQGEIAYRLSDIVCHFSCDHCRTK